MSKVICYTKAHSPNIYDENTWYFELFSIPSQKAPNIGHVGNHFLNELQRSGISPSPVIFDFTILAMSIVAADKAILRRNSPDGWTRQIELEVPLYDVAGWTKVKKKLEYMLRFLSGDFWTLTFVPLQETIVFQESLNPLENDCVCLLSGGMDSLVGGIDLCTAGRKPLFVAQTVRGDAAHQREYANALGKNNLCQWSCYIKKNGAAENSTRARSIIFFAFALLASCRVSATAEGRKEIYVPENGFISLNIHLTHFVVEV